MNDSQDIKAEVIAVFPDKVKISVGSAGRPARSKGCKSLTAKV